MNGFFMNFEYLRVDPVETMKRIENGYIFQGFGVILSNHDTLTGPEWAAKFAELIDFHPENLQQLLEEISLYPDAERSAKLHTT